MNRRYLAASLAAATAIGAGGGAAVYAAFDSGGTTTTVVRQVAVGNAQAAASTSTLPISEIYRRAYRGVVEITVTTAQSDPFGGSQEQQGQGSGFVYDARGDIVTNDHVVDGATKISVKFWNGAAYSARVVGTDPSTDLAVIRVSAPSSLLHPLTLGSSSALSVGDAVVAIGSPFGLEETATAGIVSALHRQMTSPNNYAIDDSIQTDAAINHGNSGGPLLNGRAQVVGVNAQIDSETGGNDGVGFAIPSNTVRSIVSRLISSGKVDHAYLGVALQTTASGVRVARVESGTAAERAGLKAGDVITAVDGRKVVSGETLRAAIDAKRPGEKVSLTYTRAGKTHTVRATLGNRPS